MKRVGFRIIFEMPKFKLRAMELILNPTKVKDKTHIKKTIEHLKSKMEQGPQTRQIIAAFRSIEHRDFNYLLMVSTQRTSASMEQ